MRIRTLFLIFSFVISANTMFAQEPSLLEILDKEHQNTPQYVNATFKHTKIAIGHSVSTRKKGVLDVSVANRFWNKPVNTSQSFVADLLSSRFGLEYSLSDNLSVGFGGTSYDGIFDSYLKYKLVKQRKNGQRAPISVTVLQGSSYLSKALNTSFTVEFSDRFSYTSQILIARKISSKLSLQITPTFIHKRLVTAAKDPTNQFAVGFGGRYKVGRHVSIVSEYYYNANPITSSTTYNPFVIGVNWELGALLLQFNLTNTVNMAEDQFITRTKHNFNFKNPNLHFGFNATYSIHFKRPFRKKKS